METPVSNLLWAVFITHWRIPHFWAMHRSAGRAHTRHVLAPCSCERTRKLSQLQLCLCYLHPVHLLHPLHLLRPIHLTIPCTPNAAYMEQFRAPARGMSALLSVPTNMPTPLLLIHLTRSFLLGRVHRCMHPWFDKNDKRWVPDVGRFLYRHVHSLHHKSYNPTAFSGTSMHPVEVRE
jgi:hypothetical protein